MTPHRRSLSPRQIVTHGQLCRPDLGFDDYLFDLWWSASALHDLAALPVLVDALGPLRMAATPMTHHRLILAASASTSPGVRDAAIRPAFHPTGGLGSLALLSAARVNPGRALHRRHLAATDVREHGPLFAPLHRDLDLELVWEASAFHAADLLPRGVR